MASRSKTKTTRPVLIIAIDPGTSTLSARYAIAYDSFNDQGQLEREVIQESLVDNWPSSSSPGAIYLPTTLVFSKVSKELLHWGFAAQTYLEEEETVMNRLEEVVIENVKIVLQQPEDATELDRVSSLPRHRETRNLITQVLGKTPDDIFEEFLTVTLSHIFERAILEHAARSFFSQSIHVEFVICFPGGWSGALHTRVAKLAANAMQKSMEKCQVRVDNFGLQDVYTVSETLSGIREWLYKLFPKMTETYAPEVTVTAFNAKAICENDIILAVDIGAGTACITTLRLIATNPLRVDQLGGTLSLPISGDAVDGLFEQWLSENVTEDDLSSDFTGNLSWTIKDLVRAFRSKKVSVGEETGRPWKTWRKSITGLKANPEKGFLKDILIVHRMIFEQCFDPVVALIEKEVEKKLSLGVKAVIFQGQFGGGSQYLRKRLQAGPLKSRVRIFHSPRGKEDVVLGAMSQRAKLQEKFIRNSVALKSYGILLAMTEKNTRTLFGDKNVDEFGILEVQDTGRYFLVIDWVVPSGSTITDSVFDRGPDAERLSSWKAKDDIEILDVMVVSEETLPAPTDDPESCTGNQTKKQFTLWTKDHDQNKLFDQRGHKVEVQQLPFKWDLGMSQKIDKNGVEQGPYVVSDMKREYFPRWHGGRAKRRLHYVLPHDLIWEITEVQLKISYRPKFHYSIGQPTTQLGVQVSASSNLFSMSLPSKESRSVALDKDIEFTEKARPLAYSLQEPTFSKPTTSALVPRTNPFHEEFHIDHPPIDLSYSGKTISTQTRPQQDFSVSTPGCSQILSTSPALTLLSETIMEECETCARRLLVKCDMAYTQTNWPGEKSCQNCLYRGIDCLNSTTVARLTETTITVDNRSSDKQQEYLRSKRKGACLEPEKRQAAKRVRRAKKAFTYE